MKDTLFENGIGGQKNFEEVLWVKLQGLLSGTD